MGFFGKSKNQKLLDAAKSGDVTAAREAATPDALVPTASPLAAFLQSVPISEARVCS